MEHFYDGSMGNLGDAGGDPYGEGTPADSGELGGLQANVRILHRVYALHGTAL